MSQYLRTEKKTGNTKHFIELKIQKVGTI